MKAKGKIKSAVLFVISFILIAALAYGGYKGFVIGGWQVNSFGSMITKGLDLQGGVSVLLELSDDDDGEVSSDDLEQTKELIDLRVNSLGVSDTTVTTEGTNRIRVEIPGSTDDVTTTVESLTETGELTFQDSDGNVLLTGDEVEEASVQYDSSSASTVVALTFTDEGAEAFAAATEEYYGDTIYIYMDDECISSPTVSAVITDGEATINGLEDSDEAQTLASLINAGALPVSMTTVSTSTVGATLGADALPNAKKAGIVGVAIIFLFMILYYRVPGIIASIALSLYICLVLITFAETGVALNLPGIAAFLLTIGMAVDANVLIFERIKEELRKGVSVKSALDTGFHNALSSILDSNITTLIAGLVLYYMGSGSVKGFAVTLMIGIVISMFTAVVVTRTFMNWAVQMGMLKSLWQFRVKRRKANA